MNEMADMKEITMTMIVENVGNVRHEIVVEVVQKNVVVDLENVIAVVVENVNEKPLRKNINIGIFLHLVMNI